MMMNRRALIAGAGALGAASAPGFAYGQPAPAVDLATTFGFVGPADDPEFGAIIRGGEPPNQAVGTGPARHGEVATAFRLLFDVDQSKGPLGAARYFEALEEKNSEGEFYKYEWAKRANPLIVGLFSMTNTLPSEGDQTHWCAAFVNFCLYATGKANTFSALSGSFRKFGTEATAPVPGDVAVFSKTGDMGKRGFGHVAFYISHGGGRIRVLGGNQRGGTGSSGAVVETDYPVQGSDLFLVGIRKAP
jgi:uncharacterized protein (TIGR02594 family)